MNPANSELVSIIISAYNAEKYLAQTLDSVLAQTWPAIEVIVVNDGSTDATPKILNEYSPKGIKILSQENLGQDAALNAGYKKSTGQFIKFMDSDDLINPEMIERQVKALKSSPLHVAYGEWARFYYEKPEEADFTKLDYWRDMEPVDFLTARPSGVMLQCGIMLFSRELVEKAGLWNEQLILFNDTEFFNRVILASDGVRFTEGARLFYRSGMLGSISAGRSRRHYESTLLAGQLIASQLLPVEDSVRTRRLISNTFLMQYYHMYPKFPDLLMQYENEIRKFGEGNLKAEGGTVFQILEKICGWKIAKRMQRAFYDAGYLRLKYRFNELENKKV